MRLDDYMTTDQAAERLRLSTSRVRQLALGGRLRGAIHIGQLWLFPRAAIEDFARLDRPAGNPNFRKSQVVTGQ